MRIKPVLLAPLAAAAAWAVFLGNCSGPRPVVGEVIARAPARAGEPWSVEAAVRNRSWGDGDVSVTLRLTDRAGHVFEDQQPVHLEGRHTVRVVGRIAAPPGEYHPEARVEYPPQ